MFQEFKAMPEPLQKQTLIRLGFSAVLIIVLVALLTAAGDIYL